VLFPKDALVPVFPAFRYPEYASFAGRDDRPATFSVADPSASQVPAD